MMIKKKQKPSHHLQMKTLAKWEVHDKVETDTEPAEDWHFHSI
jgi:hypothetical protein